LQNLKGEGSLGEAGLSERMILKKDVGELAVSNVDSED
jgi:hypothetical protein